MAGPLSLGLPISAEAAKAARARHCRALLTGMVGGCAASLFPAALSDELTGQL